ncbi:hypothetical protein NDU88_001987 [Pleurodeles waltl]|uniref:Uncharacterized protein n=1 Tax=Pleurodeles waltl TaxID=8319 RepID=A0AAV7SAC6_PLEWA|nr:hypothetical protein NDU88_001987 [Pleurodeles waltl]
MAGGHVGDLGSSGGDLAGLRALGQRRCSMTAGRASASQLQGPWQFDNVIDITMELQRQRASFAKVKQLLWECNREKTHFFPSTEDAWTGVLAKGLVSPQSDAIKTEDWVTPQTRCKKKPGIAMHPSRAQAAASQPQALMEANQFSSNQYAPLPKDKSIHSNSSQGRSSASTSPSAFGPELTPHIADDL